MSRPRGQGSEPDPLHSGLRGKSRVDHVSTARLRRANQQQFLLHLRADRGPDRGGCHGAGSAVGLLPRIIGGRGAR